MTREPAAPVVTPPQEFAPGTLGFSLAAESEGLGSVRFVGGRAYWTSEGVRFPAPEAA